MASSPNIWRVLYREAIPREQTLHECDFIESVIPAVGHPVLLDLACGTGRHSIELAARGYQVLGVDIDSKALQVAAEQAVERTVTPTFINLDLRHLDRLDQEFDGIILFWQSYGFFNAEAQVGIFAQLQRLLRPGGHLVIDIFNRLYYDRGRNEREQRLKVIPTLPKILEQDETIYSMLGYEDNFRFRQREVRLSDPGLTSPGSMNGIAANHGLHLILSCSEFTADIPATDDHSRMQLVFEKIH